MIYVVDVAEAVPSPYRVMDRMGLVPTADPVMSMGEYLGSNQNQKTAIKFEYNVDPFLFNICYLHVRV